MDTSTALTVKTNRDRLIELVTDSVASENSKRAYTRALKDFMAWHEKLTKKDRVLNKATVQRYAAELTAAGASPANVNQRLSAIRKLASEAADNGFLDPLLANGIGKVKGLPRRGHRVGNWLTRDQAQVLLDTPDTGRLKGIRDRALLALLLGTGLRRSEAAGLAFADVQQRDGRWVIVDLLSKGDRVRTVPVPSWTKAAIDTWTTAARLSEGHIFRSIRRGGQTLGDGMTGQAIDDVVKLQATRAGLEGIACHDLRRTFAKLARKGDSPIEQIQLSLGHERTETTTLYLGVEQDLVDAPCDRLGLRLTSVGEGGR